MAPDHFGQSAGRNPAKSLIAAGAAAVFGLLAAAAMLVAPRSMTHPPVSASPGTVEVEIAQSPGAEANARPTADTAEADILVASHAAEENPSDDDSARPAAVRRRRQKARAPKPGTTHRSTNGWLTIDTQPWTEVSAGGRRLGLTPMEGVRLPAGRHVLTLRNPAFLGDREIVVVVEPGETTRVLQTF